MIVIDTSALMAVLLNEPEEERFSRSMSSSPAVIAAPTAFEFLMVADGRKQVPQGAARQLMTAHGITVRPWTTEHLAIAHEAFLRFGKGRHPAGLNFGDCMSYALARALDAPLLFKGDDFARTDVKRAL